MSVCVGIDVHRKRSQVAVIDQAGQVLANRNVPNGVEPILGVIGGLPPGTPAAFEAASGWGWLVELLEDYGFEPHLVHPLQCKAIASARLKNDKGRRGDLGAAAARGPAAGGVDRAAGGAAAAGAAAAPGATGAAARAAAQPDPCGPGRSRSRPAAGLLERPWPGLAGLAGAARRLPPGHRRRPGADRRAAAADRPAGPGGAPAGPVRPTGHGPDPAPRRRGVHRAGPARRDRRHHPVRLSAQAGVLGRAHPDRARQRPHGAPRAHHPGRARSGCGGSCARPRRPPGGTRTSQPATRTSPAAAARRSPPPRSPASCSPAPATCSPTRPAAVRPTSREGRQPRVSSRFRMSRPRRAR